MEGELRAWMQAWWEGHPEATLTEIEAELDRQVAALRVGVLQETLAHVEAKVSVRSAAGAVCDAVCDAVCGAVCPVCGAKMEKSGRHKRRLKTTGGQVLELERAYLSCPRCGKGFFPPGP